MLLAHVSRFGVSQKNAWLSDGTTYNVVLTFAKGAVVSQTHMYLNICDVSGRKTPAITTLLRSSWRYPRLHV